MVMAPFANPTAQVCSDGTVANADVYTLISPNPNTHLERLTGNCFLPLLTVRELWHFGPPLFFSTESSAQTFNTGSELRSSHMVTNKLVPSTCFRCVTAPLPCAKPPSSVEKVRTMLNCALTTWTLPSEVPRNRVSEPAVRDVISEPYIMSTLGIRVSEE